MSLYPYDDIVINGRAVRVKDILNNAANMDSDFERNTFEFISDWLKGQEEFFQNTSGSTGTPKTIHLTRSQMMASATASINALGLKEGFHALLCISPEYIGGKMMLVRSLIGNMKIIATTPSANPFDKVDPEQFIDFVAMVPYQVEEVLSSNDRVRFSKVRTIIIGGAPINADTEKKLQDYSCTFYSTYGMTETISHIALRQLNGKDSTDVYKTLPGIRIHSDERNCLVIEWDQLHGNVITNDLVEIVNDNEFRWIGRLDNVINTGGVKVIPEKIEPIVSEIFSSLNILNSFFVGSVTDVKLGSKVTLFIEGELGSDLINTVEQEMWRRIPKFEAPKQVILIKSFVLTENGKINRRATIKPYISGR